LAGELKEFGQIVKEMAWLVQMSENFGTCYVIFDQPRMKPLFDLTSLTIFIVSQQGLNHLESCKNGSGSKNDHEHERVTNYSKSPNKIVGHNFNFNFGFDLYMCFDFSFSDAFFKLLFLRITIFFLERLLFIFYSNIPNTSWRLWWWRLM